jgi:hypothetical protein
MPVDRSYGTFEQPGPVGGSTATSTKQGTRSAQALLCLYQQRRFAEGSTRSAKRQQHRHALGQPVQEFGDGALQRKCINSAFT